MANTTDLAAGFIGLGTLGEAIAGRLRATGVELSVWNRTREKAEEFCATAGATAGTTAGEIGPVIADTPAALISQVPVVLICLSDSDEVEVVLRGKDGLLSGDCAGKLIIDCTTNHHLPVVLFHELARNRDAAYDLTVQFREVVEVLLLAVNLYVQIPAVLAEKKRQARDLASE